MLPKFFLGKITNKYLIIDIIHYGINKRDLAVTLYKLNKRFRLLLALNYIYIISLRDGSYSIKSDKVLEYAISNKSLNKVKIQIDSGFYFARFIENDKGKQTWRSEFIENIN